MDVDVSLFQTADSLSCYVCKKSRCACAENTSKVDAWADRELGDMQRLLPGNPVVPLAYAKMERKARKMIIAGIANARSYSCDEEQPPAFLEDLEEGVDDGEF